jgi:hypothetical protein
MNSKRLYRLLIGLIALLFLGVIGGAYELNSMLEKQANTLSNQRQQLAVLEGQQTGLNRAKKDITKYEELAAIAKVIVPQDKSQAQTIGEINKLAAANNIRLSGYAFPTSNLGGTTKAGNALSQLVPVKTIAGVYSLQITVTSDPSHPTPYSNFLSFMKGLENNRRTTLVQSVTITPNPKDASQVTFSLILEEYIKP